MPPTRHARLTALLRYLRIAFSVGCGVLCLLLVVLWVRSYWRLEILEKRTGLQAVQISSVKGRIATAHLDRAQIGRSYLSVVAGDAADWRKGGRLGFAYYEDGFVTAFIAPHWLLALLSAALAVIPWISRSWRFSLRTLLIATTLVAVLLGVAVMMLRGS
jgi:phosphotransferase system  glucose/maltose/N-acetylglucosamine-specific IIC component